MNQLVDPRQGRPSQTFVNNARIIATFFIGDLQTLHLIDAPLEFAYVNRKQRVRESASRTRYSVRKTALDLDELANGNSDELESLHQFYARFSGLSSGSARANLYEPRSALADAAGLGKLGRDQLSLERLLSGASQFPSLKSILYNVNETNSLHTYFLPIQSEQLESALESGRANSSLFYEAHIVPNQVHFLRTMPLGLAHASLFNQNSRVNRLELSLAKSLPTRRPGTNDSLSRQLLSSPLLLQANCVRVRVRVGGNGSGEPQSEAAADCQAGVTSAEILVANIPIKNGVLHLIRKPIVPADASLLDYLNDHAGQLSELVDALGSRTSSAAAAAAGNVCERLAALEAGNSSQLAQSSEAHRVDRFRELLARNVALLASLSAGESSKQTILAPSNEAFARLRSDTRALLAGDEQLVPSDWDSSRRQQLVETLVRRHVIRAQSITSDAIGVQPQQQLTATSEANTPIGFKLVKSSLKPSDSCTDERWQIELDSESSRARSIQHDLVERNGVLHIIDAVLGEQQETLYSALKAMLTRFRLTLAELRLANPVAELKLRIDAEQSTLGRPNDLVSIPPASLNSSERPQASAHEPASRASPQLDQLASSIGQFLDDLQSRAGAQFELLATSVNISCELSRLTGFGSGELRNQTWAQNWLGWFDSAHIRSTLFLPSDFAWLRLLQAQPQLYKPLMHFLYPERPSALERPNAEQRADQAAPRASQSSQRLKQVSKPLNVSRNSCRIGSNCRSSLFARRSSLDIHQVG